MRSGSAITSVVEDVRSAFPNQPPELLRVLGMAIEDQIPLGGQRAYL
jgi:hypothetical protein